MKNKTLKHDISIMAPLIMLIIFSVCVMFVLLFGAKLYKKTLNRDQSGSEVRTVNQYLTTRFRQGDGKEMIFIGDFDTAAECEKGDTFFFAEKINSVTYYTRIYCYEGYLCELFSESDAVFERQDGERILPLTDLQFSQTDGLVTVTVTHANGRSDTLTFWLRSNEGRIS